MMSKSEVRQLRNRRRMEKKNRRKSGLFHNGEGFTAARSHKYKRPKDEHGEDQGFY